jgi:hypothetical protein
MSAPAEPKGEIICSGQWANGSGAAQSFPPSGSTHAEVRVCEALNAEVNSVRLTQNAFPCDECCEKFKQRSYKLIIEVTGDQGTYSSYFRQIGLLPPVMVPGTGMADENQIARWDRFPVYIYFMGGQITKVAYDAAAHAPPERFHLARAGTGRRRESVSFEAKQNEMETQASLGYPDQPLVNRIKGDLTRMRTALDVSDAAIPRETWAKPPGKKKKKGK